jgi:mannose-6-phosphate isomerase
MLYPVLFKPIYKKMLWGGTRMHSLYGRELPYEDTGESWDISCRPNEMGVIENGADAGMAFADYIARDPKAVLGTRLAEKGGAFPLLVKIIDANAHLSTQVHPDDAYAKSLGGTDTGKSEMWYIMVPPEDGRLIIGIQPGTTPEDLLQAHESNTMEDFLHYLHVEAGDIVDLPAGLVHAITKGVIVAEVQQNSDITYRLYDYNRPGWDGKPRPLQIKESLETIDFSGRIPLTTVGGVGEKIGANEIVRAISNQYYAIVKYILREPLREASDPEAFCVFTCVAGNARFVTPRMSVGVPLSRSVYIPAGLGEFEIQPLNGEPCVLLKSFVPA